MSPTGTNPIARGATPGMRIKKNIPNPEGVEPFQGSSGRFFAIFSRGYTPGYEVEPFAYSAVALTATKAGQGSFFTRHTFSNRV